MSGFRPISLCNVSYKVISKILSLRLKRFLPELISETQSAFVAGRLITDNILIAQENFHALRSNPANRKKFMALKTDMSKAYDRVEWGFLRALMEKMGFNLRWIDWIMQCITSVSYRILINGDPKGRIRPSRGIRQGDPMSPYLFILCTEALIAQIRKAEREGKIQGLRISHASPRVSHLLFADDSLFFCQANADQSKEVIDIIRSYGEASGQEVNLNKSSIMFGNEVPPPVRQEIKTILGISREGGMGTYLGLPEKIHGSKAQVFAFVRDRLQSRVNSWSSKFLSKGGKEVLIKSQAQALPTYVMSCFLLPKAICSKLTSAIANFWWSNKAESRGIHWIAWDQICTQLSEGGLGFRSLEDFNLALLAKQLWRLLRFPDSLLSRVLKGRYFRYSSPLEITVSNRPSYGWRSMLAAKDVLRYGIRKTIGSGFGTYIWTDPWIPDTPARPPKGLTVERDPLACVNTLIDFGSKQWKMDRLRELFPPEEITLILGIKPSRIVSSDGYCWIMTKSGNYTVKSGYEVARSISRPVCDHPFQGPSVTALKAQAWKLKTTRKLKHFVWQCVTGCLASSQRLFYRHIGRDKGCSRCGAEEESINHLLFECPPARQVWALSNIPSSPALFPSASLYNNLDYLYWRGKEAGADEESLRVFPWIMWYIWKARNRKIFENLSVPPQETLDLATQEEGMWRRANQREDPQNQLVLCTHESPSPEDRPVCSIDGSWLGTETRSGHGWLVFQGGRLLHLGLKGSRRSLSPLHAELDTLIWTMKCLLAIPMTSILIQTDCSDLLAMTCAPKEWPTFSTELQDFTYYRDRFTNFSLKHIPRSGNTSADYLAKCARNRGFCFSHVSSTVPEWLSLEESLIP
ncbi:Reverse transcriptase domain [Arabidopsis thaliana x Arabidopsis arenosa]|uniref:Reverse transcriptase domain n=1 Tax=Arabidopsis thaliana x Arabidopsis arenosa TaxID=1240361 RepID=A0A8T2A620_9BRAS|nr:Reverse transcriptase domain [Arabidopsis thaliana x Arabidopsis arenosa]